MSHEQPMPRGALAGRREIQVRFDRLKRSPGLNVIGVPELIGLAGATLLALIALFAYLYFLAPAHARLVSAQLDRDRLQGQLRASEVNFTANMSTREVVDKLNASLEDFESNWLLAPSPGRRLLYRELNNLIRSNSLRNTAGPTYTTLEPLGTKPQLQPTASAAKQSNAKWQSVYPGVAVSVTVEGPYQNIRHFVRDIETSRQFLVVNAVELESITQTSTPQGSLATPVSPIAPDASAAPRGGRVAGPPPVSQPPGTRATLVSLRLDLATYFRRAETEQETP